ncbi:hypothetical protein HWV62_16490 [Athelia sp. TMB]|nr:hypothetical protein HWV62_16490 [Athelia sp. TMB]
MKELMDPLGSVSIPNTGVMWGESGGNVQISSRKVSVMLRDPTRRQVFGSSRPTKMLSALSLLAAFGSLYYVHAVNPISSVTPAQWAALNTSVSGRLYLGYPWVRPCYSFYNGSAQTPDSTACAAVQSVYKNDSIGIAPNFGAYMNTNWGGCQRTGQGCVLDYTIPQNPLVYAPPANCYQGSVAPYYVDVHNYTDLQAVFMFANSTRVSIYIKNSGHDYKGRSSAPNALGVWTPNLQGITYAPSFTPDSCIAGSNYTEGGVTFGAGTGFLQLYQFADANNITVVGGSSPTVGAGGGWITGAGHSAISNTLGLGVDNALQIRAVTPNGEYVTANHCQNQDLFFALRGGGGSTFGIITEVTTRANPRLTLQVSYIRYVSLDLATIEKFLAIVINSTATWADEGWGGYIEPGAMTTQASGFVLMTPKLNLVEAQASMAQITGFAADLLSLNIGIDHSVTTEHSYYSAYQNFLVPNEEVVGLSTAISSRLIPRSNFLGTANQTQLLNALLNVVKTVTYPFATLNPALLSYGAPIQFLVTTPANYPGDGTSSVTPAWRSALWHVFINSAFENEASASEIAAAFKRSNTAANFLRAITPGSGAYQNEADIFEPDYIDSFWGAANYARLSALKEQYDPYGLLQCWNCIGWNAGDPRYACYPEAP